MKVQSDFLLNRIPDFTHWEAAQQWLQQGLKNLQQANLHQINEDSMASLEWNEIAEPPHSYFGHYSSLNWRKFVLATFFSDLACYSNPEDQVNFERLLYVMHAFPQGFRIWWLKYPDHSWWPIGYTGWYPISETAFEIFEKTPEKVKDRWVAPLLKDCSYLYLFNYSVLPALKATPLSKLLMTKYAEDIQAQSSVGLSCITVSEEGARVATRFGMRCSGHFKMEGSTEGIFTLRRH